MEEVRGLSNRLNKQLTDSYNNEKRSLTGYRLSGAPTDRLPEGTFGSGREGA